MVKYRIQLWAKRKRVKLEGVVVAALSTTLYWKPATNCWAKREVYATTSDFD